MSELGLRRAAGALGAFISGVGLADVAGSDRVYAQVRNALNQHESQYALKEYSGDR